MFATLLAVYPLRLILWARLYREPSKLVPLKMPTHFDPAPILYPQAITVLATLLVSPDNPRLLLPNLILCLCSLPEQVIPSATAKVPFNSVHWLLSCAPLYWATARHAPYLEHSEAAWSLLTSSHVTPELAVLLYPLHQSVRQSLHYLTTTSLLPAELELFSISLINVLLLSSSPQMRFLKALLWVGGMGILVVCGPVISWGIALARVPKWRFRRHNGRPPFYFICKLARRFRAWTQRLTGRPEDTRPRPAEFARAWSSSDESDDEQTTRRLSLVSSRPSDGGVFDADDGPAHRDADGIGSDEPHDGHALGRSRTFPIASSPRNRLRHTHTSAGRKRRSMSTTVRALCTLTQSQA
ncbi:hypothetical protein IMZ48_45120, partial [Candidatus Bathyarchaeota archaeon]|nr:hypothetical protein [Candidatus Bathyarchaeota archaeon]